MRHTPRNWTLLLAGALIALASLPAAAEDVITIDFTGLDLKFAGGNIYDADHLAGGSGSIADATALGSITFYKNYEFVTTLDIGVYADILVQAVPGIPENDWRTTGGGSFVDLLSSSSGTLLGLPIGEMTVSYTIFDEVPYVGISGIATGTIVQNLPDDLVIDPGSDITILLIGDTLSNRVFDGELLVGFDSSGTGQIEGAAIPEPGSLVLLLCLAAMALVARSFTSMLH